MKIIKNNKEYDGEKMLRAELKKYTALMITALICMAAAFLTVFIGYAEIGSKGCTMIGLMLLSYYRILYIYTSPDSSDKGRKMVHMIIYYILFLTSCMLFTDAVKDIEVSFHILNIYAGIPLIVLSFSYYIEEHAKKKALMLKSVIAELRRKSGDEESGNKCQ